MVLVIGGGVREGTVTGVVVTATTNRDLIIIRWYVWRMYGFTRHIGPIDAL
jgi:hypothetical protein